MSPSPHALRWPDDYVAPHDELDDGTARLVVHPEVLDAFRQRGWVSLRALMDEGDVTVQRARDHRETGEIALNGRVFFIKRHREPGRSDPAAEHEATALDW